MLEAKKKKKKIRSSWSSIAITEFEVSLEYIYKYIRPLLKNFIMSCECSSDVQCWHSMHKVPGLISKAILKILYLMTTPPPSLFSRKANVPVGKPVREIHLRSSCPKEKRKGCTSLEQFTFTVRHHWCRSLISSLTVLQKMHSQPRDTDLILFFFSQIVFGLIDLQFSRLYMS